MYITSDYNTILFLAKIGHSLAIVLVPTVCFFLVEITGKYKRKVDVLFAWAAACVAILALIAVHTTPLYFAGISKHYWGYYPIGGILMLWYTLWTFLVATRCLYILNKASKIAEQELNLSEFLKFKYYSLSLGVFMFAAVDFVPKFKFGSNLYPFGYVFVASFSSLITYAIIRHRLLDVQIVIRRSFVYSLLIAVITIINLGIVLISEHFFRTYFGYASIFTAMLTSSIIALAFNPLRLRIQKMIDLSFFHVDPEILEKENNQLKKTVQEQDRMKAVATLAAGMAHEIKNPLTAIKTFTDYLPSKSQDPDFVHQFKKIVSAEIDKIDSIVKQLLEFSKPSQPVLVKTNIVEIIDDTLHLIGAEFVKRLIQIVRIFTTDNIWVKGDKKQLQQAFLNLFLNSSQAMPDGGLLEISLDLQPHGPVKVIIRDTGRGITKENLSHIFDPFFTTKSDGTGLGLAITHGILKQHNCSVSVKSGIDAGTSFSILFDRND